MDGGDFSRCMGQEEDPKINAGGTLYLFWSGEPHIGGGQFIYLIMRGACYR